MPLLINSPEAASRLARTIVSDIALYNRDKIILGIKNDNIFDLLAKELKEGLDLYQNRVDPALADRISYFNRAIVDVLIKRSGDIKSQIW
jgi:hypothetical protein